MRKGDLILQRSFTQNNQNRQNYVARTGTLTTDISNFIIFHWFVPAEGKN